MTRKPKRPAPRIQSDLKYWLQDAWLGDIKLPDWQRAEAYPKTGDALTWLQWAWEFLRRNHEYVATWHEGFVDWEQADQLPWLEYPEKEKKPNSWDHPAEFSRFGLLEPLDPNKSARDLGCDLPFRPAKVQVHLGPGRKEFDLTRNEAVIVNTENTELPVKQQLERAKHQLPLQDWRAHGRLRNRGEYPMYLRVLDAHIAGVKQPSKIAAVLHPRNELGRYRVRSHLEQAAALCWGGYRRLIAKAEPGS